ncbi:hypothetical protein [Streptomyces lycii]|uniref:TrbL/VirB6 plasmid conjugal transfer protein n=1 Tax=Streptomyces lycii TaxID=2654337 RepID=A0ABQ7FKQ7_9ACTN|nr:hypothetical protein [Streptomyces lycii]KAF4408929.1 hypothetical protein GCU69_11630 [Streptomyces lycii]
MVVDAVSSFLGMLIEQIMKPVRAFLADTLLATPDVTGHADVRRLWTATLGITVGIYVLFVTAGGLTVMGHETMQNRYALKQVVPRLLVGMVAAASSLTVMGKAIGLSNALAHAITDTEMSDAGHGLVERAIPLALFDGPAFKLYQLFLALLMLALVVAVLIGFMVRIAVMALLAVCGPLALACHAHPLTDPVARLWWRGLGGCMVVQIAQSTTFVLGLKLFFAPGAAALGIPKMDQLGTMLAGLALFWVLFKIPGWTMQVVLRGTPVSSPHTPAPVRMLKHAAMYRLMDTYLPGVSLLRRRPGGGAGGGRAGFGRGGGGGPGSGGGRPGRGGRSGLRPPGPAPRRGGGGRATDPASPARGGPGLGRSAARTRTAGAPAGHAAPPARRVRRAVATSPAPPKGPRSVIHPAQARRTRQLALPMTVQRLPARPSRPTQLWLPVRAERVPASRPSAPTPSATPAPGRPAPTPRTRQMTLPIRAERVRMRPPRPMQLRLPLEPPGR